MEYPRRRSRGAAATRLHGDLSPRYYYSASRDASQWEAPANWKPGVKDDWEQCFDETTGHHYYYSASRNESVWEAPRAAKTPDSKRRPRRWETPSKARPTPSKPRGGAASPIAEDAAPATPARAAAPPARPKSAKSPEYEDEFEDASDDDSGSGAS